MLKIPKLNVIVKQDLSNLEREPEYVVKREVSSEADPERWRREPKRGEQVK